MVANIKQANIDYHVVAHVPCNTTFRVLIVQKFIKSAVGNDYKEYHSTVHLKYLEQPIRITYKNCMEMTAIPMSPFY